MSRLQVDPEKGLTMEEASKRLAEVGFNLFEEKPPKTKMQRFLSQLRDPLIYILFAAVLISLFLKEYGDVAIIFAVIFLNAIIGAVQESKAEKSLEALKKLSSPVALVRRDGLLAEVAAKNLVPGDIVLLEAGRIVPADLRLVTTVNLQIEESALTGESVAVEKRSEFVATGDVVLGDRINMAYQSTHVTYGRGEGIVVETGMNTEIGKIAKLINESPDEMTPLQKRLADLGKVLGVVAIGLCAALFVLALIQGRDIIDMLITAISLAVAAVPEGLPAVVTIVLALGVQRMVRVNTIIRKLPAVETLGSVSVVCSDKTGTLTQNKMTVTQVYSNGELVDVDLLRPDENHLLIDGLVLCTDATIHQSARLGDPTELALLDMGERFGVAKKTLESGHSRINEKPFDSVRKMMTTVHRDELSEQIVSFTKGAMDQVLIHCREIRENGINRPIEEKDRLAIQAASGKMSALALRVLALAVKFADERGVEEDLIFLGLVGMMDPPRPEAKSAVAVFNKASVSTIMITGDHRDTALAIARDLGIAESESQCISGDQLNAMTQEQLNGIVPDIRVFARVSPENKVMIVKAFQSQGNIVSMTGDGVNDAPSLKIADIGVAMGINGTDVAKGAADMILTDDNFATIEKAIEEGRNIYNNIRKSVLFLLSSNLGEILTMLIAIAVGLAMPLKAIHILWVNLITDSLPALALGVDPGDKDIMNEPPRNPKASLFANGGLAFLILFGCVIGSVTLAAFLYTPVTHLIQMNQTINLANISRLLENPEILIHSQTYAFTALGISQLFNAIGVRNLHRSIFRFNHLNNRMMIVALVVGFAMQVAVTEIPFLTEVFDTAPLTFQEWLILTGLSAVPLLVHELMILVATIHHVGRKAK